MPTFGELLKIDRERLGLSQEELAKRVGVTQQAVANWENGTSHPRKDRRVQLLQVLGPDAALVRNPPTTEFVPAKDMPADLIISTPKGDVAIDAKTARAFAGGGRANITSEPVGIINRAMLGLPSLSEYDIESMGIEPRPYLFHQRTRFLRELAGQLPEQFVPNIDTALSFGHARRIYEYASKGVVARIMRAPGVPALLVHRATRHVLHLAMASQRHSGNPEPSATFVLFIVASDPELVVRQRIAALDVDAGVLGVKVSIVRSTEEIASMIPGLEDVFASKLRDFESWMRQMLDSARVFDAQGNEIEPDFEPTPDDEELPEEPPHAREQHRDGGTR
jgi:transcriptional regulator with XRE-family HTH domain